MSVSLKFLFGQRIHENNFSLTWKKDLSKERNPLFVWSHLFNQETDAAYYFLEMLLGSWDIDTQLHECNIATDNDEKTSKHTDKAEY